jgi:hypothetical protein
MESLIFFGLLALVGAALLRALLPTRSAPPQIVYVVAEPQREQGGAGCLPAILIFVALVAVLWLAVG